MAKRTTPEGWHGMLMKGELVRATIEGRKTETRRVVTRRNSTVDGWNVGKDAWAELDFSGSGAWRDPGLGGGAYIKVPNRDGERVHRVRPRIESGHHVWVKETWASLWKFEDACGCDADPCPEHDTIQYRADTNDPLPGEWPEEYRDDPACPRWRSSMLMKWWASRLALHVLETVPERVQMITEDGAEREGVLGTRWQTPIERFAELWDEINAKRTPPGAPSGYAWRANPWVWVHRYTLMDGNPQEVARRVAG